MPHINLCPATGDRYSLHHHLLLMSTFSDSVCTNMHSLPSKIPRVTPPGPLRREGATPSRTHPQHGRTSIQRASAVLTAAPDGDRTVWSNLDEECGDPDADEERIAVESVEDVALAVDLAGVDLVEERHHDERVEDDGEVLRRSLRL